MDMAEPNRARRPLAIISRDRIDPTGFDYGAAFAAVTEDSRGGWVSYVFGNAETGAGARKHTWLVRRGNLLFGAGWYE